MKLQRGTTRELPPEWFEELRKPTTVEPLTQPPSPGLAANTCKEENCSPAPTTAAAAKPNKPDEPQQCESTSSTSSSDNEAEACENEERPQSHLKKTCASKPETPRSPEEPSPSPSPETDTSSEDEVEDAEDEQTEPNRQLEKKGGSTPKTTQAASPDPDTSSEGEVGSDEETPSQPEHPNSEESISQTAVALLPQQETPLQLDQTIPATPAPDSACHQHQEGCLQQPGLASEAASNQIQLARKKRSRSSSSVSSASDSSSSSSSSGDSHGAQDASISSNQDRPRQATLHRWSKKGPRFPTPNFSTLPARVLKQTDIQTWAEKVKRASGHSFLA